MATPTPHGAMPELKPCPFCGQSHTLKITAASELFADEDEEVPYMHSETYAVICDASKPKGPGGCGGQAGFHDTEAEALAAWNRRAAIQQTAGAVPEGCRIVPMEPSKAMLDRAVAFALNVSLGGSYGWTDYMRDLYARMLSAVPSKAGSSVHLGGGEGGGVPQPRYRLLNNGDVIEKHDEFIQDDGVTWLNPVGWEVGARYGPPFKTARRPESTSAPDGGKG